MESKDLFDRVQPRLVAYHRAGGDLQLVCDFVSATPNTVMGWTTGTAPQGARLIRLWHFLALNGHDSPELIKLPAFCRYISELFAFQCITLEEVLQYCGVTADQTALQIMRGQPPMHPAMSLDDLKELYNVQLETAKAAARVPLPPADTPVSVAASSPEPPATPPSEAEVLPALLAGSGNQSKITTLATLLSAALPLVRLVNSDKCKPADRALLRELMGTNGVFELSNHLNDLCGERSRSARS